MTDNLFDRLAELFRSPGPVNWRLAREIAESVAGPPEPIDPWTDEEFRDLAATAQRLVSAGTPLDALAVGGPVRVLDRREWATTNVQALDYIAEPIAERIASLAEGPGSAMAAPLLGMQIGALTGFISHRVLGSFDAGLPAAEPAPVTFVGRNVAELSTDRDLDPQQVRMWAALHEVAHHAGLAVPWVREHLLMLGHAHGEEFRIDTDAMTEHLGLLQDPEALQAMLDRAEGMPALEMPIQVGDAAARIAAFAAVLAGYADIAVERAGGTFLPDLDRIRDAARERRVDAADGESMLHRTLGITIDADEQDAGVTFCRDVARRWGHEALDRVWEGPDLLPTADELTDPTGWAARVLLSGE